LSNFILFDENPGLASASLAGATIVVALYGPCQRAGASLDRAAVGHCFADQ